jgi:hypothetical protein
MRWAEHVEQMGETRNAYNIFVVKPECKRPFGRSRHRWVDNIGVYLRKIGGEGEEWIDLAQDKYQCRAVVNTVMNVRVP